MSNSTHPSNLDNIKELLDQLDQEYNATYRSPDAIAALVKTIKSFNITITDWNTLVDYISVLGSTMRALIKTVPEIAGLIAPMYGYVDLESDQDVRGLKDFKDGIKIGTAPTNDADATTKLYVDTNVQNVREVAEGKCKTLVLDYATTIGESSFGNTNIIVKKETGEVLESYQDFLNYIGNRSLGNALLNSVEQSISADMSKYYFVEQELDNHIYTIYTELSAYNTGDILLIIETSVPDRWLRFIRLPQININKVVLYKLEISKLDIQNIPDYAYVTTSNRPSGLTYGLRIKNNGWTSEIQQEGGAKIELTSTAVKTGNIEIDGETTMKADASSVSNIWKLRPVNDYSLYVARDGSDRFLFQSNMFAPATYQSPSINLGSANYTWKDLYLAGQINFSTGPSIKQDSSNRIIITGANGADRIKIGGETSTYCAANWTPDKNATYNLGSSDYAWKDLYFSGSFNHTNYYFYWDNGIIFKTSSNTTLFYIGNDSSIWFYGTLIPAGTSGTKNIGDTNHFWKDLYLAGAIKGITTMTQAQYDALATKEADTLYFIEEE